MESTPKSMRLQIALLGRTNVGKSRLTNLISGQNVAIVSDVPGTTTDVVEKQLELLPIGPVNLLDTSGIDDTSELGKKRIEKTLQNLTRADLAVFVVVADIWTPYEEDLVKKLINIPFMFVVNKCDVYQPSDAFLTKLHKYTSEIILCSAKNTKRDVLLNELKNSIKKLLPETNETPSILGDLVPKGGTVVLITPIDSEAPKGRLILPQVQTLRDCLDNGLKTIVVREKEYAETLKILKNPPDLVVCDSQVVKLMTGETPETIPCTTFSILFARLKGDFKEEVMGAFALSKIKHGNKILIAEACSHHAQDDDIGTVKIPKSIRKFLGFDVPIDKVSGRDYPANLADYSLIVHCGACMLTRREKLNRIAIARENGVPITNYGMILSLTNGVLRRVLSPFKELENII